MKSSTPLFLVLAVFIASAPAFSLFAEPPAPLRPKVTELMRRIDPDNAEMEIVMVRLELAPGASSLPHMHKGFIAGYVESGRLDFQLEGEPLRELKAGDTFYEAPRSHHLVTRNPDLKERTTVIAFTVQPKGAPVAGPIEPSGAIAPVTESH